MNIPRSCKGLAILAGGLAFVGSANAVDLIVNGSLEDAALPGSPDAAPFGWTGACKGYNYSQPYFSGPPIPASENPGNVYSWRHRGSLTDDTYSTPMTQSVNLLSGATAADIDGGNAQFTFSAWMSSYTQNPDMPYVTLQFYDAANAPIGTFIALDRVASAYFTRFADGTTVFDDSTHLHDWGKYVATDTIPAGARTATVGIQHSPNSGLSGTPDSYTDLVKLDVRGTESRPQIVSSAPTGASVPANAAVQIVLQDGTVTVNQGTIVLTFDGAAVVPNISKVGALTTISHAPGLLTSGSLHAYRLIFSDNGTPVRSQTNNVSFTTANYVTLPAASAYPSGSGVTPGFTHRTVQATGAALPNTLARARAQLAGTLIDSNTGLPFFNIATPGPNIDGSYNIDGTINFEQTGTTAGAIPGDQAFPGLIPADQDNFSTEALGYIELAAGYHRFGVNSDDGFEVSLGLDPVDATNPSTIVAGAYDGGRGAGDTLFDVYVPTAGVYGFRLIYEEGTGGASCEFFSVNPTSGLRTLVNDLGNPGSVRLYRSVTGVVRRPYVREAQPAPGSIDIPVETVIRARIWDGATAVVDGSVQMTLDGSPVAAVTARDGIVTTTSFQPATPLTYKSPHTVQVSYGDGGGTLTKTWTFTTRGAEQPPAITGHWDFDSGDLSATIGSPLEYFDGPAGTTAAGTSFGTTTSFGIPDIGGFPAKVVKLPAAVNRSIGLMMRHGAVPNGGATATKVNQWTYIIDVFIPDQSGRWHSFLQIDTLANNSDGELFADFRSATGTSGGLGISGQYTGNGAITKGNWHRIAFAVDSTTVISKFIDGVKFGDQTTWDGIGLNGRHALQDRLVVNGDESGEGLSNFVNSIQVRNYKMTDDEIAALGGPDANGIPTVSGQWDFNDQTSFDASLRATLGTNMKLLPDTEFNTTFVTVGIGGQNANIMRYAGALPDGYIIVPGNPGNGGGLKVNKYTLLMDLMIPDTAINGWHSLWQTQTNNNVDASLFLRPASSGGGIGISSTYHGNILPNVWYRLAFSFDLATSTLKKYTNGVLAGQQTLSEGIDGRWAVGPTALLFADNDGDNGPGNCNSVQFHPRVLSDAEILSLGRPAAAGIPVSIPHPLTIRSIIPSGFDLEIQWAGGVGPFQVQMRESLSSGAWADFGLPTSARTATVDRIDPTVFYRVVGQ